jgi:hypothetical protein
MTHFPALVSVIKIDHSLTPSGVPIPGSATMPAAEASLDVTLTGMASKSFCFPPNSAVKLQNRGECKFRLLPSSDYCTTSRYEELAIVLIRVKLVSLPQFKPHICF